MSYNLQFYTRDQFIQASRSVGRLVNNNNLEQVSLNLHYKLFNGGTTEPKSLKQMLSISTPSSTVASRMIPDSNSAKTYERIEHKRSYSLYGIVSLLEGIPVIGSAIAILSCLGHFFGMLYCKEQLKDAAKNLSQYQNRNNMNLAKEVHKHAVDFARHDYYLQGSALAIFPFLKPLLRITQALAYAFGERPVKPVTPVKAQPVVRSFTESNRKTQDPDITLPRSYPYSTSTQASYRS